MFRKIAIHNVGVCVAGIMLGILFAYLTAYLSGAKVMQGVFEIALFISCCVTLLFALLDSHELRQ